MFVIPVSCNSVANLSVPPTYLKILSVITCTPSSRSDIPTADRVSYLRDMASKLAMDKRLDDFVMILESNGSDLSVLVGLLDARMVSARICGLICEGRVGEVVRVFRLVEGLGIGAFELCDESVKAVLGLELRRLVEEGELGEVEVEVADG
ncbi:hypothetical protein Sjap_022520 [Stephania japonica]|uniref:Uncharacterized protein n=1 Tax=Stephania japonica TaxID=461633 RepID=A0AAP0EUQ6_9MAGN